MDGAATGIIGGGPVASLGSLERWWNNPGIAIWIFVLFGSFLLNATLLLAFLIRPGLRTISNRFVMNLTASNLLTCAVLNPLLMMDGPVYAAGKTMTTSTSAPDDATSSAFGSTSTSTLSAGGNICAISEGATALVTTSSVLSVLLIAIDQYFAVVDPLRYRARVDKLKSGVLIASVWLVSAVFGLIAALNPNPRSLWLSCTTTTLLDNSSVREYVALNVSSTMESPIDSVFAFFGNETYAEEDEEIEDATSTLLETIESIKVDSSLGLLENDTVILSNLTSESITYGLIYVVVHSVFAYLLPFAGICWIYISIYSAAHRNSERTRRTGSRPILASASFCDDPYGATRPQHQTADAFPEEFRRIPKISSLSSIDETSETAHSANQISRRRSFSSSSDAVQSGPSDENTSSGVVFTVGLQPVKISSSREQDGDGDLTEAAGLQTDYLEDDRGVSFYSDIVRNEDAEANRRRRLSRDSTDEARESSGWIAGSSSDSESEDERRYGYFDTLEIPGTISRKVADRRPSDYLLSLAECETTEESRGDTVGPTQDSSKGTNNRGSEEENSIVNMTAAKQIQNEIANSNSNVENKRSRRSSRRSSRSGIADGNGDSHVIIRNTESNNLEPSSCLLTPIVTITPAPGKLGTLHRVASIRSTSSYINSLKHRISNGSLFRYREETRAARISALVIVMGLICWSPYVLLSIFKNLPQYSDYEFPHKYDVLALSFLILAAFASPLLFGYRSRRVKRELRKFFCFRRELSYKNNRSLMAKKVLKRRHSSTLSHLEMDHRYNIFNCVYGRSKWPKEKVQFVQVPDTALAVETCRSSFSSGASTQISSTSTEEC
ncbi:Glucose-dependent insulinotropic receptor [Ooceraea biroi]|uniref:Glucose-dependent insulinotropic receptor n=1 Tax=Ooceraea biroi TaxID=2015173 RepID=A0A026WWB5_OOCBI|nr:Glucose-dependent insulinotropic receptor [Ooceraea biroi]